MKVLESSFDYTHTVSFIKKAISKHITHLNSFSAYSAYIIISGSIELFSHGYGTLGCFPGGDTLGEEGIIDGDKAVIRN